MSPSDEKSLPVLDDHVDLGRRVGRGAFGEVRRGRMRDTGIEVAVKLALVPDEQRSRVFREAELLRGVRHPALANFEGLYLDPEYGVILVYEFVDGEPLSSYAAAGGASSETVLDWIDSLAAGLDELHRLGLVHRDVKPDNVIVDGQGRARLIDYGLARETAGGTLTATGMILGTPPYLSPEVFRGEVKRAGPAGDVYALACLAFRCLHGAVAHDGETLAEVAQAKERPPPRLAHSARVFQAVFDAALSPDPARRFADATQLADALRAAHEAPEIEVAATRVVGAEARAADQRVEDLPVVPPVPQERPENFRRTSLALFFLASCAFAGFLSIPISAPTKTRAPMIDEPGRQVEPDPVERLMEDLAGLDQVYVDEGGHFQELPETGGVPKGWLPVGEDPAAWPGLVAACPALHDFFSETARRDPKTWSPKEIAGYARARNRAVGLGLPDPGFPVFDVKPGQTGPTETFDAWRVEALRIDRGERFEGSLTPWEATQVTYMDQVLREYTAFRGRLDRQDPQFSRELGLPGPGAFLTDPEFLLVGVWKTNLRRAALAKHLAPLRQAFQGFLFAAGNAARDSDVVARERAAGLARALIYHVRLVFFTHLMEQDPRWLIGGSVETPQSALLAARILQAQKAIVLNIFGPEATSERGELELLSRALESPSENAFAAYRISTALDRLYDLGEETGDFEPFKAGYARVRDELPSWLQSKAKKWVMGATRLQ